MKRLILFFSILLLTSNVYAHWKPLNNGLCFGNILALNGFEGRLFLSVSNHGIFYSDDFGETWEKSNTALPTNDVICFAQN